MNPVHELGKLVGDFAADRLAKLQRGLSYFDETLPDGSVRCCGVSVVMENASEVYCSVCGRRIRQVGQQWVVADWGLKGIRVGTAGIRGPRSVSDAEIDSWAALPTSCAQGGEIWILRSDCIKLLKALRDRLMGRDLPPAWRGESEGLPEYHFSDGVFRFWNAYRADGGYRVLRVRVDRDPRVRATEKFLGNVRLEPAESADISAWFRAHPERAQDSIRAVRPFIREESQT